jgi:hypothetical protein
MQTLTLLPAVTKSKPNRPGREYFDLATGRVMIYVCPDCGDIGCGAITAAILDLGTKIVWRDFAYESGDDGLPDEYLNIEPIEFERQNYFSAFSK